MRILPKNCARRLCLFLFAFGIAFQALEGAENKLAAAAPKSSNASGDLQAPILAFVAQRAPLRRAIHSQQEPRARMQLRPVVGVPGAAALGDPISLPSDLTRIEISPTQTYLLAERGANQELALLSLGAGGTGPELTISGTFPRSTRIEFSISGSAAALYSASLQSVQVITGLPDSPQVSQQFNVSSLPASLTALAVSDDGTALLAGVSDGQTGGIYLISASNGIRSIASAGLPAAIRFLSQSDKAVVADSHANQVLLLSAISGAVTSNVLARSADGAKGPNRIEMIGGNRAAVVANTGSNPLIWVDMPTGKVSLVSMSYSVGALHAVNGNPVVLVSSEPSAFWLLSQTAGGTSMTYISVLSGGQ